MYLWLAFLCGVFYPNFITLISQTCMNNAANGSPIWAKDRIVGFELIGQKFETPGYFWARPSAADYNPLHSGGSNLGPTSKALELLVEERREKLAAAHAVDLIQVPNELLFASGSGLDPHISVACAFFQIPRIAKARGLDPKVLHSLVELMITPRRFHILGTPTVNVLLLNKALDETL